MELMLREQGEGQAVFVPFLNKPFQRETMLLQLVPVEPGGFGPPLLLKKETILCGTLVLIMLLVGLYFSPLEGVWVVAGGVHALEGMGVLVEEVDQQVHVALIPDVGEREVLVMKGRIALWRDMMAETGSLRNIMMVLEVVAVEPRL